jgi:Rrf2 family transcriptional regulator, cysteine metabolism repressor
LSGGFVELALRHGAAQPVPVKLIAELHGIPSRYLMQILLQLKGGGVVLSIRGAAGGYHLAKRPEEITLSDILTLIDGPLPLTRQPAVAVKTPATQVLCAVWSEILATEQRILEETTFAELVKQVQYAAQENMYYI